MKKCLCVVSFLFIYITVNSQVSIPGTRRFIDNKVNVNVQSNSTVKIINPGETAIANSLDDANDIKLKEFKDAKFKEDAALITLNPMKAYDLGTDIVVKNRGKGNFIKYEIKGKTLHESLFTFINNKFENTSNDGVRTTIESFSPEYTIQKFNIEDSLSYEYIKLNDSINHDLLELGSIKVNVIEKQIERSSVFGFGGFLGSLVCQEKYLNFIKDRYMSYSIDGILFKFDVTYSLSKNKPISLLKERRNYLRPVIEKFISGFSISNYKFKNEY